MAVFFKDPNAVLDYQIDWSAWLDGDTIASYTLTPQSGLTIDTSSSTSTAITLWVSGGTAGNQYTVLCRIVTAAGRTEDRTVTFVMNDH